MRVKQHDFLNTEMIVSIKRREFARDSTYLLIKNGVFILNGIYKN